MLFRRKFSHLNIFVSLLIISPIQVNAIVNMDALHFDSERDTFSADLDLTISGSSGNSKQSKTAFNGQFTWITKKSIHLTVLGY